MTMHGKPDADTTATMKIVVLVASEGEFRVALATFGDKLKKDFSLKSRNAFIKHYGLYYASSHQDPRVRDVAKTLVVHSEHMDSGKRTIDSESTAAALAAIEDYRSSLRGRFSRWIRSSN